MSGLKLLSFVVLLCHLCVIIINNVGVEASHMVFSKVQSQSAVRVNKTHITGFHFRPPRNWINDPNGPMYYNGIYHLFYQYNPYGSVWGNIVWAHSVSTDMINWKPVKHALSASKPFDIKGCWSGSATILPGNKPILLYTGIDSEERQLQNYALPANLSDPYLQDWIKPDNNPLIFPGIGINATQFRDPTTAWLGQDGKWRILVGGARKHRGIAYLYRSRDFMKWTKAKHPLHSKENTWNWECPDFFPVSLHGKHGLDTSVNGEGVKHVLKVSLDETRYEYYTVGTYDTQRDKYIPDNTSVDGWSGLRCDYGNFYASKSFFDAGKNRRILWGWANESDTSTNDTDKGWAGIQTIPRSVWLDPSERQLIQWPIEELETLRMGRVGMKDKRLKMGEHAEIRTITAAQADVDVTFLLPSLDNAEPFDSSWIDPQQLCAQKSSTDQGRIGPFGILALASKNLEEYTPVFFRIFKAPNKHIVLMCSDARSSSVRPKDLYRPTFAGFVDVDLTDARLSLRSLIDHSMVESFGAGGKTCITSRVYPELAINKDAHLFVFNNGSETITVENLRAYSMRDADMDKDLKL